MASGRWAWDIPSISQIYLIPAPSLPPHHPLPHLSPLFTFPLKDIYHQAGSSPSPCPTHTPLASLSSLADRNHLLLLLPHHHPLYTHPCTHNPPRWRIYTHTGGHCLWEFSISACCHTLPPHTLPPLHRVTVGLFTHPCPHLPLPPLLSSHPCPHPSAPPYLAILPLPTPLPAPPPHYHQSHLSHLTNISPTCRHTGEPRTSPSTSPPFLGAGGIFGLHSFTISSLSPFPTP